MALKRKPVPQDSPVVVAVRERMKPVDTQTVVAKTQTGELVVCRADGTHVPFVCAEAMRAQLDKELKPGGADSFAYRLINSHKRRMGTAAASGWVPVKKAEKLAACPHAYGDETSALIHDADTILHKRPMSMHRQRIEERQIYNQMQMASAEEQLRIAAESTAGVRDYTHTEKDGDPSEGLTLSQPGV
ncbi:MAG: hypothetical protein KA354_24940 [Phycisphaerae bacterium]|nr:hypothetical protein [Phycisphaerae bacterium]